jgi:class 3 adenylate cyclase/tetratricopeptide (TPR) repeat protein
MGMAYYIKGDYPNVLNYWQQSLDEYKAIEDNLGVGNILNNIGAVYYNLGDNLKALEYYLQSLKVSEKLADKLRILTALTNIGSVYSRNPSTYDKAEAYMLRALPLAEEINDQDAVGTTNVNLGNLYLDQGKLDKSIVFFEKALISMKETGGNESYVLTSLAKAYRKSNNFTRSLEFLEFALSKAQAKDAKLETTMAIYGKGDTYFDMGQYPQAIKYYNQALILAKELGSLEELKNVYESLAKTYSKLGDYNKAYSFQNLYMNAKDTLFNIENEKRIDELIFQSDLNKKQDEIEILNKENALKEGEINRAKIFRNFLLAAAGFLILLIGGVVYQYQFVTKTNKIIIEERNKTDKLLRNILPIQTAEELKSFGFVKAKKYEQVTVLFTDFVNFTSHVEKISPEDLVRNIDFYFKRFDEIFEKHKLEKIKTIGDAYMCAGSIPIINKTHPQNAVEAGLEILEFLSSLHTHNPSNIHPFNIRIGINTGPVIAGVVGKSKFQYDIWGDAVNIASRMETTCEPNKVNISESTYNLVKDKFTFEYRGNLEIKNRGKINMYYVTGSKKSA